MFMLILASDPLAFQNPFVIETGDDRGHLEGKLVVFLGLLWQIIKRDKIPMTFEVGLEEGPKVFILHRIYPYEPTDIFFRIPPGCVPCGRSGPRSLLRGQ